MNTITRPNDLVHWFMNEITSQIIAESGIPTDRFHLGKIILKTLEDDPDFILQIDGATNQSECNGSVKKRSVMCATKLQAMGLKKGDAIILMAPNHLDLAIPFYAALYLGIIVAAIDMNSSVKELNASFNVLKPKIIFCQSEKASDVQLTLNSLELDAHIVTFDKGDYLHSFADFLKNNENSNTHEFKPIDFNPEETIAFLVATSGTTGHPKAAAVTHKNFAVASPYLWAGYTKFPRPTHLSLVAAPLQWLTAILHYTLSPILRYGRLQSSLPITQEHACHLINTYKPTHAIISPTMLSMLLAAGDGNRCDFSCFELLKIGGNAVSTKLIHELKLISPNTKVLDAFGMSELSGLGFHGDYSTPGSCGKPIGCLLYRLIDVDTQNDVLDPHIPGELWLKGPGVFKEYYNNPEATAECFSKSGWFKTGDLFYRDENWNYFFLERIKLLMKYKSYQISPFELEDVIRQHSSVMDVAVTSIPDPQCGDLPVACVVPRDGLDVTADEIKELIKNNLSDPKQLRGGVIFLPKLPMTATTKVHRKKLKELVLQMDRQ